MNDRTGARLHKSVKFRIFTPGNTGSTVKVFRARGRSGYAGEVIEKMIENMAEQVEKDHPNEEYQLVPIGLAQFNFVWRCRKGEVPAEETKEEV